MTRVEKALLIQAAALGVIVAILFSVGWDRSYAAWCLGFAIWSVILFITWPLRIDGVEPER